MANSLWILTENRRVLRLEPVPRLRLLVEWESPRRVFFGNLADLLRRRELPPLRLTSRPARFWRDVFVPTGTPWFWFPESLLLHVLFLIVAIMSQSKVWTPVKQFEAKRASQTLTYYSPRSFPAASGRASRIQPHLPRKHESLRPASLRVPSEPRAKLITPPDLKQPTNKSPNVTGARAIPPMQPLAATGSPRRSGLAIPSDLPVTPPPQVDPSGAHRLLLPGVSPVSPAPAIGASSVSRAFRANNLGSEQVVSPPPSIGSAGIATRNGQLKAMSDGVPDVVPPPPSVDSQVRLAAQQRMIASTPTESQVVSPPPSVPTAFRTSRTGQLNSLSGAGANTGANVVPPPASLQGLHAAAGSGGRGAALGAHLQAVPAPPSVQGSAHLAGGARANAVSGLRPEVVPPPPGIEGLANSRGIGQLDSPTGSGSQVVAPPPSGDEIGRSFAQARQESLLDGSPVVSVHSSVDGGGISGTATNATTLDPAPAAATAPVTATALSEAKDNRGTVAEFPLGSIGLVFALPGTSYFSNFEVFIAKRRLSTGQMQFIKLVYVFLPYQRRLSEYNLDHLPARTIKLRVNPDPSCNESVDEMIWPQPNPNHPVLQYRPLPDELSSLDPNLVLPCYRTTASDFKEAMTRSH